MNKLDQLRRFARLPFLVPPRSLMTQRLKPAMTMCNSIVVDRTGALVDPAVPNIVIDMKIPEEAVYQGDFREVCDRTAAEVMATAGQNEITVLYSGGLDSAAVACALLKAGARINILGTTASINENPVFYREVLERNPLVNLMIGNPLKFVHDNPEGHLFVTGECGAHIMGTINWRRFIDGDPATDDMKSGELFHSCPDDVAALFRKTLDRCPVRIRNNYDAMWWSIFALKWQFVQFRFQMWAGGLRPFHNFFMTDAWQHWALTTPAEEKCPGFLWKNYKMPIRDYIFDFCRLREASYDMPKRNSMELSYPFLGGMDKTFVLANPRRIGHLTEHTRAVAKKQIEEMMI